jgi:hypothetical protein
LQLERLLVPCLNSLFFQVCSYRNHKWTHRARTAIHDEVCPSDIATEPTCQKPCHPAHLFWQPGPFQPNVGFLHSSTLHLSRRQLRRHATHIEPVQANPDIDLPRTDTIYPHTGALEHRDAGSDDAQRSMAGHGVARAPAPAVRTRCTTHDDNAAVSLVLGRRVRVVSLARGLGHRRRGVFEREEGGHGVCFEAFLQVGGRGGIDGRGAEEAGRADPDVKATPGVKRFVDECEGVLFRGDGVRVVDHLGVGVCFGEVGGEARR